MGWESAGAVMGLVKGLGLNLTDVEGKVSEFVTDILEFQQHVFQSIQKER
jgi:hypothetical protein